MSVWHFFLSFLEALSKKKNVVLVCAVYRRSTYTVLNLGRVTAPHNRCHNCVSRLAYVTVETEVTAHAQWFEKLIVPVPGKIS